MISIRKSPDFETTERKPRWSGGRNWIQPEGMELELQQLDRRYEALRKADLRQEKRLLASLASLGQQSPVVVVSPEQPGQYVLVDGYKRVRALSRLRCDVVQALQWDLPEADALVVERLMREAGSDDPIEQGWLLVELRDRFGLSVEELGRRFDKSSSWVSRRLALVTELPGEIQKQVRQGRLGAHAAMKYLVPLARANTQVALRLSAAISPLGLSSRQIAELYGAVVGGSDKTQQLVLSDPWLFLRAQREARRVQDREKNASDLLLSDLGALGGIARRVYGRLSKGVAAELLPEQRDQVARCFRQAQADTERLFSFFTKESFT